jgi:hypothetical protein
MPNTVSPEFVLVPPPEFDIDYTATANWVNTEMSEWFAADAARFEESAALEDELNTPLIERVTDANLLPDAQDYSHLIDRADREFQDQLDQAEERDRETDVIRQAHHVPGHSGSGARTHFPPYSSEMEDDKRSGVPRSFADAGSGRMRVRAEAGHSNSWDWSRASLAQFFVMPNINHLVLPVCSYRINAISAVAHGFFVNSTVELDQFVFTFNITQQRRWVNRRNLFRFSNWVAGIIPGNFPNPAAVSMSGFGSADKDDRLLITTTLIARAKAPHGYADIRFDATVTSMTVGI